MIGFLSHYWFPLALIAILILAIPGFVLFGLNLVGLEGEVNGWLESNLSLSYHIPFEWWWALALLLVPFFIILLYFLKLKRKPLSVPSTFLWKKSIEDLHVNSLLQWLRHNVLLLLQLLAVLAMIYAIMGFRFHGRTGEGMHYILMIDNSASMSATDAAPSRMEWAKEEALKEIDASTDNDVGMVIEFNSSAQIRQSFTTNRDLLRIAVRNIQPTQRPTRIEEALSLADSLANPSRSTEDVASRPTGTEPGTGLTFVPTEGVRTEVHLFSDGRFPDVPDFQLGNLSPHFHLAGKTGTENADNVAIVGCNALRDETDATKLQIFVRALNFRGEQVRTKVQLEVRVDGQLKGVHEKLIDLPARKVVEEKESDKQEPIVRDTPGEGAAIFDLVDVNEQANTTLHARLLQLNDSLPLDDDAWLVVGVVRKARVLIVGNTNEVLDAFFDDEATRQVATVDRLTPDMLSKDAYLKPARNGAFDLVIFDRCGPAEEADMPRANTFFIGHPPPPWKPDAVEKIETPHVKGWLSKHAILRHLVALQEIGISEGFKLKDLPSRTPCLMESDQDTAVLLTLSRQSFTDLVMTFAIKTNTGEWNTNWPLQPSFPLFLRNVLYTLGNVSDAASEESIQPGQVKTLRPEVVVEQISVVNPEGQSQTLDRGSRADFAYGATDRIGVYDVGWNGEVQRSFAVNLLDADESNVQPRDAVKLGAEHVTAGQERGQPRDTWKWAVLAASILLLAEWYIYNRRVYI